MTRLGSLSAFAAFGVFWGAWAVLLPAIKEQTGASVTALGVALLFVAAAALPAMFLTGLLIDRIGPRVLPFAATFFGLAVLLPGLAQSPLQLALALVLVGVASGALDVVDQLWRHEHRSMWGSPDHAEGARVVLGGLPCGKRPRGCRERGRSRNRCRFSLRPRWCRSSPPG